MGFRVYRVWPEILRQLETRDFPLALPRALRLSTCFEYASPGTFPGLASATWLAAGSLKETTGGEFRVYRASIRLLQGVYIELL